MLRSMYSSISGLRNFQQKLDVTSNNIANVNTFGFKKGRVTFKDMVSQQIAGATGPTDGGRGGSNPRQIGLGVQLGTIDTVHTQGSLQSTNRELDLGIDGDGFFIVTDSYEDNNIGTTFFTRAGNFYLDEEGYIVTGDGYYLLGKVGNDLQNANGIDDLRPIQIDAEVESFSIGENGIVTVVKTNEDGDGETEAEDHALIHLAYFANPEGLQKVGSNLYIETANSGSPFDDDTGGIAPPGEDGTGRIVAGTLEMSNVDLAEEFTEMIVAQRGFQANTRGITTADEILQELMNIKR